MIDNIGLLVPNISQHTFDSGLSKLQSFEIVKQKENVTKVKWLNMHLVYYANRNLLEIKNSVHKLHNIQFGNGQPDNSTDFTLSQFITITNFISETFGTEPNDISVLGRFEFGVNIENEQIKPYDIIERYMSYKSIQQNPFVTIPPRNGKPKHRCCYLSDYRLKAYYKDHLYDIDVPPEKDVLRYEVVTTELRMLRKITGLNQLKLRDLCHKQFWKRLGDYTLETYDKIQKYPLPTEGITEEEVGAINNYCSSIYFNDIKNVLSEYRLRQLRGWQKTIYDKWNKAESNIHNVIRNKMSDKIQLLISN